MDVDILETKKDPQVATNQSSPEAETGKEEEGQIVENAPSGRDEDVAAQFLSKVDPAILNEPITYRESRKLLWKIDFIMIPLITTSTILAAVSSS